MKNNKKQQKTHIARNTSNKIKIRHHKTMQILIKIIGNLFTVC